MKGRLSLFFVSRLFVFVFIPCWAVIIIFGVAQVNFIDVLSQKYSIMGEGHGYWSGPETFKLYNVEYSETSDHPLSNDSTGGIFVEFGDHWTQVGGFALSTDATGGWTSEHAWVQFSVQASDEGNAVSWGSATASITFRPLVASMLVNPNYNEGGSGTLVSLVDLTDGSSILSIDDYLSNHTYLMSFDLSHIYTMSVTTAFVTNSGCDSFLTIESVSTVPESSTMAFLVSSLLGLGWVGKRFRMYLI